MQQNDRLFSWDALVIHVDKLTDNWTLRLLLTIKDSDRQRSSRPRTTDADGGRVLVRFVWWLLMTTNQTHNKVSMSTVRKRNKSSELRVREPLKRRTVQLKQDFIRLGNSRASPCCSNTSRGAQRHGVFTAKQYGNRHVWLRICYDWPENAFRKTARRPVFKDNNFYTSSCQSSTRPSICRIMQ